MWSSVLGLLLAVSMAFQAAVAPYAFHFPRDHATHDRYRTEWWYFTGHLQDRTGRRFGFELTFFRVGLEPRASHWAPNQSRWYAYQLYPAHLAITDIATGTFVYAQTFARDALGAGSASQRRLDVHANTWSLTGTNAVRPVMRLQGAQNGNGIDLVLQSRKPPAIHGHGGISKKGPCASCASHYYSFTRLAARGTVLRAGKRYAVDGIAWMDHEYGSDQLTPQQVGWDWFAIQLDDDREIMLYRLRERNGTTTPESSGSLVDPAGRVTYLPLRAFTIAATGSWRSPHTNALYPSGWRVHVDGIGDLVLTPVMRDQELADPTGTSYWEGDVDVRDARTGKAVGQGYVELTGYARPIKI